MVRGRKPDSKDPKANIHIMISQPRLTKQLTELRRKREASIGCKLTWTQILESILSRQREPSISQLEFVSIFFNAITRCQREYRRHEPEKGNSWRTMNYGSLRILFTDALSHLWLNKLSPEEHRDQIVDVINLGLMVLQRHSQEGEQ